jgi:hypothetical protein
VLEERRSRNPILDIRVTLTPPPQDAPPEVIAGIDLHCETSGLSHTGDLLTDPLTQNERHDLQWYLEEYWLWPYEGFAQRAKEIEALLPVVGQRLFNAVFGSMPARDMVEMCSSPQQWQHQISVVSDIPSVLSLSWELLHNGQHFLSVSTPRPVSIVRRLPFSEQGSYQTAFASNLADLLLHQVQKGQMTRERLVEAQGHAERALAILESLDASSGIWTTLSILARIADLDELKEVARDYHHRECEAFVAFEGNRYSIDREHGFLITALASAVENPAIRDTIVAGLSLYEAKDWHITTATQRIWAGERDWHLLAEDLDRQEALLILRVLETLNSSTPPQITEEQDQT